MASERQRIECGAPRNQERFRETCGRLRGTLGCDRLFDEASFGKVLRMRREL